MRRGDQRTDCCRTSSRIASSERVGNAMDSAPRGPCQRTRVGATVEWYQTTLPGLDGLPADGNAARGDGRGRGEADEDAQVPAHHAFPWP
jgi:hypothetical protein